MSRNFALLFASLLAGLCLLTAAQEPAEPGFDHEHRQLTRVLAAVVRGDRVDYELLSRDHATLDQYVAKLVTQDAAEFAQWTKQQRCAFWINAYNAFTLETVLANYPLQGTDSLRDVGGVGSGKAWKQDLLYLGRLIEGQTKAQVSLDDVIELVLRPQFKDARIHAALCRGFLGGPALLPTAFTAPGLDRELDTAARAWLADPARTRFLPDPQQVEVSDLFGCYREDFMRDRGSLQAWIARYAPSEQAEWLAESPKFEVRLRAIDWKLNDIERKSKE